MLLTLLAVAGCGGAEEPASRSPQRPVTVALDFVPNPVHAPIYLAGDAVRIQTPGSGPDGLKLVTSGKVELGVLDIHDLAIARAAGTDVVAVGALVGKPLAALVAQPDVARPRDLEGRTVGVSGLPSDPAFLKAIVEHDGGDVSKIKQVTIGFNAVSRLLTKRVDAVPVFWNAEGVALQAARAGGERVPRRGLRRAAVPGGRVLHLAGDAGGGAGADRGRAGRDRARAGDGAGAAGGRRWT